MSISIQAVFPNRIHATCTEPGCVWETVEIKDSDESIMQLEKWHAVHRIKDHRETPETAFYNVHTLTFEPCDFSGHTPHGVSAEDFTESHNGAEEVTETQAKEAINILADRIKTLQAKANARDLDKAREQIRGLKQALKIRINHDWETSIEIAAANARIAELENAAVERETLITAMRQTIQELMETPDPMPLCKNLEGHRYVALEERFVFCTFCGHSIHYKIK